MQRNDFNVYMAEQGIRVDLAAFKQDVGTLPQLGKEIGKKYSVNPQNLIFLRSNGQQLEPKKYINDQLLSDRKVFIFNKGYYEKEYNINLSIDSDSQEFIDIEESFITLEKQFSTSCYQISEIQYKEKLGEHYEFLVKDKNLKGRLKNQSE